MQTVTLSEIGLLFLKLGLTGFGGPAVHVAMMRREVVEKRAWLSDKEFMDLYAATHLIPGPNSTELAIHIGHLKGGWPGLLVAGLTFILPAFFSVLGLAVLYVKLGSLPVLANILTGMRPAIVAIMIKALWDLRKSAIPNLELGMVALITFGLVLAGMDELLLILGISVAYAVARKDTPTSPTNFAVAAIPKIGSTLMAAVSGSSIFWFFAKMGSVLFGTGYVLLAFLQSDLVDERGWLTQTQLLDAITVGQVTPGPVFTTATFIGYLLKSYEGAFLATLGIFLPAFFFVAISAPFLPKLRSSLTLSLFLNGIVAASWALLAKVCFDLGGSAFFDLHTILIGAVSLFVILKFRTLNSVWVVLSAGLVGIIS